MTLACAFGGLSSALYALPVIVMVSWVKLSSVRERRRMSTDPEMSAPEASAEPLLGIGPADAGTPAEPDIPAPTGPDDADERELVGAIAADGRAPIPTS